MTSYVETKNTIMSNPNGVMKAVHYFDLAELFKTSKRVYFYKFSYKNLVEIHFYEDVICIYYFSHTPEELKKVIKDNLNFYKSYFESAGLYETRFLFDLSNKLPVSYKDFIEKENPQLLENNIAFMVDKNNDVKYVTGLSAVKVMTTVQDSWSLDNSMLSLANNLIRLCTPKNNATLDGCLSSVVLSGLFSGLKFEEIVYDVYNTSIKSRIVENIAPIDIQQDYFDKQFAKIKHLKKLKELIPVEFEPSGDIGNVNYENPYLSDVIKMGLDQFMKGIKNSDRAIIVNIDEAHDKLKYMYIVRGAAWITPGSERNVDYFVEMLSSENVTLVNDRSY